MLRVVLCCDKPMQEKWLTNCSCNPEKGNISKHTAAMRNVSTYILLCTKISSSCQTLARKRLGFLGIVFLG